MPQVITAVAAALQAIFPSMTAAWATWTATFVVNTAVAFAMSAVFSRGNRNGFASEGLGRAHVIRSSIQPRNIIYGETVTSGPLIFAASSDRVVNGAVKKNDRLHLVIALAGHEVEEIGEVYLNDRPLGLVGSLEGLSRDEYYARPLTLSHSFNIEVPSGHGWINIPGTATVAVQSLVQYSPGQGADSVNPVPYTLEGATSEGTKILFDVADFVRHMTVTYTTTEPGSFVRVKKHLGGADQEADADLMAECPGLWTAAHRLRGIAYIYVRLTFSAEVFDTGLPNIRAKVKGKKVLDPRTGQTVYSNNWALCVYDYLRSTDGLACDADDVDTNSVITAANISDEQVPVRAGPSGFTQSRYSANGVLMLDHSPDDNLRQLSTAGGGPAPVLAGGVFRVHAGAYDTPTVSLNETDLRGPVRVRPRHSRRELFNAVKGVYTDGKITWLPVDFPKVKNALYASQDGAEIVQDLELPFTIDSTMAQRLAKIALERHRQGITVEFPAKLSAFKLGAWDTVSLSLEKFGWINKTFRVIEWKFSSEAGVDLVLVEESAAAYSWNFGEETTTDPAPDTNLPTLGAVPVLTGLFLESGSAHLIRGGDGTILSRILVRWAPPTDVLYQTGANVDVEYKRADALEWESAGRVSAEYAKAYINSVEDGALYNVRVRLATRRGALGEWSNAPLHRVLGKTAPPSDVPYFLMDGDVLIWGEVSDIDLAGYRIKFHYGVNRSWSDATPLHSGLLTQSPYTPEVKPQGQITLMIKAVDTTGNESANPAVIGIGFGDVLVRNVVEDWDFKAQGYATDFFAEIGT